MKWFDKCKKWSNVISQTVMSIELMVSGKILMKDMGHLLLC